MKSCFTTELFNPPTDSSTRLDTFLQAAEFTGHLGKRKAGSIPLPSADSGLVP